MPATEHCRTGGSSSSHRSERARAPGAPWAGGPEPDCGPQPRRPSRSARPRYTSSGRWRRRQRGAGRRSTRDGFRRTGDSCRAVDNRQRFGWPDEPAGTACRRVAGRDCHGVRPSHASARTMPVTPADFCPGRWSRRSAALPERSPRSKRVAGLKCVTLRPIGKFDADQPAATMFAGVEVRHAAADRQVRRGRRAPREV